MTGREAAARLASHKNNTPKANFNNGTCGDPRDKILRSQLRGEDNWDNYALIPELIFLLDKNVKYV
jgi:hypothetical protein